MASLNITLPPSTPISFSLSSLSEFHGRRLPHSSTPPCSLPNLPHGKIHFSHGRRKLITPKISCSFSLIPSTSGVPVVEDDDSVFIVVNFYHFVFIEDPELDVSKHLSVLEELDIHGRIYINEQGINAQFSGPSKDAMSYVKWLRDDQRFNDILVQISPSSSGHAFPRLKMRYKPSLVQFDLGAQDLPLLDPSMRAEPLSPVEWRARLKSLDSSQDTTNENHKSCILLDVRNGYEWDIGHFQGAQRPEVDCFRTTSFGLSDLQVTDSDPLVNVDKDKTDILMYCTGGIRCDVYSTILRQKGFKNLYTLKGGVSNYLKKEGPEKWIGNLFVFDSRLSLPPATFNPGATTSSGSQKALDNSKFARCYICNSQVHQLRHRNCANLDCNLLYLLCGRIERVLLSRL
ncbi:rhodanese-like domain-containing protein 8, chloroplastic isoform X2 [Spinacia oleracea]|uniref:Rhodanese-like domain-containing protein 8, chloroplastic isoform X2 n=1 Tax=Spinacia oleracea TaxID=3562 RepID=A0A9R0J280_SPIOL|nr:rhodanese-like domain-containing protein 8, chloroplastic isoform X2 [Spinacia oleracea]